MSKLIETFLLSLERNKYICRYFNYVINDTVFCYVNICEKYHQKPMKKTPR